MPNQQALDTLLKDVLPMVLQSLPEQHRWVAVEACTTCCALIPRTRLGILPVQPLPALCIAGGGRHHPPDTLAPARRSTFQLHVVGSNSIEWALASGAFDQAGSRVDQHVVFHGWISDDELELLYSHTRVAVAPLLSGAGVKGKVCGGPAGWVEQWCHMRVRRAALAAGWLEGRWPGC